MVDGAGYKCIKYLMVIFNIVFVLAGLALIIVGSILVSSFAQSGQTEINEAYGAAIAILVVGFIIFLLSLFGCIGSCRESRCMLITFGISMIIVCVLTVIILIVAIVVYAKAPTILEEPMMNSLKQFNPNKKQNLLFWWPSYQYNEKCCGVNNASDWENNRYYNNHNQTELPASCCGIKNETGFCPADKAPYENGCLTDLVNTVQRIFVIACIVLGVVSFIEIMGILFAFILASGIYKGYANF